MSVRPLTSSTELQQQLAQAGGKVVVVDFTATWCGPCKKIAPVLETLAASHSNHINVFSVDVDQAQDLVNHFKVQSMPTFLFFYNNKIVHVIRGADDKLISHAFTIFATLHRVGALAAASDS